VLWWNALGDLQGERSRRKATRKGGTKRRGGRARTSTGWGIWRRGRRRRRRRGVRKRRGERAKRRGKGTRREKRGSKRGKGGSQNSPMKCVIQHGVLIQKLLHGAKIVILLFEGNVDPLVFNVIIMVKLDAELGINVQSVSRSVKKRRRRELFDDYIMGSIGVIITVIGRWSKPKNQFSEHMRPVEVERGLKGFQ
jgi:hypothetical protein